MSRDSSDTLSQRLLWSTNPNKHKSTVKSLRRKPVMQSEAVISGQMHVCHHLTPCVFQYFSEAGHTDTLRKQKWLFKHFKCDKRRGKCIREGVNLWTPLPKKTMKICICTMQSDALLVLGIPSLEALITDQRNSDQRVGGGLCSLIWRLNPTSSTHVSSDL